jgi:hypothetical protein
VISGFLRANLVRSALKCGHEALALGCWTVPSRSRIDIALPC